MAGGFPSNPERTIVYGALEFTWATGSGENSWWMEGGRMAKGLCPGVVRSHGKESVEYCPSLPGLLGQVRIRGGWREVEWQKASVLELMGLTEKKV